MSIEKTAHEWSKGALLTKAQRFAETMLEHDHSDWRFGFWSSLTLEMLVRATISNISPVLVAEGKDWENIYYALGHTPSTGTFKPKSADVSKLASKAESIFPDFTKEMLNFSIAHFNRRNLDLHTGSLPFDELGTSTWLPNFYAVCQVLLREMGETLNTLFGDDVAQQAEQQIAAFKDKAAQSVKGTITRHQMLWEGKDSAEKEVLKSQAKTHCTRNLGHRVICPACNCTALLQGSPTGAPNQSIDDNCIVVKQSQIPTSFECTACGLKVTGYSKLVACELGDLYTSTNYYDPVEFFNVDIEGEFYGMMQEDNNEPF